jgi:hypothetical protein
LPCLARRLRRSGEWQPAAASRPPGYRHCDPYPCAGCGGRRRLVSAEVVAPLPYSISDAGLVVGIWFLIDIIYLAFLLRRYPERVRDMDKVFD